MALGVADRLVANGDHVVEEDLTRVVRNAQRYLVVYAPVPVPRHSDRRGAALIGARRQVSPQRDTIQAEPAAVDRLPLRAEETAVSRLEAPSPGVGAETSGGATP